MQHRSGLTLWSIADVDAGWPPETETSALRAIVAWSRSFLVTDHPQLGRDGPVCPYTKAAMENGLFLLACLEGHSDSDVHAVVSNAREWYVELAGQLDERMRTLLTVSILLPEFDPLDASGLDALQAQLKREFVEQGLMIGQFHPQCDRPGIWNPDFRPLRAPVPLLAIRTMVRGDLPFLADHPAHLAAYRRYFPADAPVNRISA